jgi:urea transporter
VDERLARARALATRHLSAIAQTFFVESPLVGLAAVAALAVVRPQLAASALLTSILARVTAERVGASSDFLATGLIELNGWFLGLACGTFYALGPALGVAILLGGPLAAAASIVMRRVLATWDVPLLVGPYVPSFWILWCSLGAFPWAKLAELPTVPQSLSSPWVIVLAGGLRGIGQIFFLPNEVLGIALAAAVCIADFRLGLAMIGASVASVGLGYLAGAPMWQVEQGLAGFTPALVAVAALRNFSGLGRSAVVVAVVASPFMEAGALRLGSQLGLHALSATYIGLVWMFTVLRPVRSAVAARAGWSAAGRPRIFENG